jgi:DNA-binding SARP family transcriptional activator
MVRAQHIHNQAAGILAQLVSIYQNQGNPECMLEFAMEWAALDGYDEAAHRSMMVALAMNGHWEAALKQYEICRDLFVTELGVELDTQTQQVYEHLLAVKRGDEVLNV